MLFALVIQLGSNAEQEKEQYLLPLLMARCALNSHLIGNNFKVIKLYNIKHLMSPNNEQRKMHCALSSSSCSLSLLLLLVLPVLLA